MVSGRAMGVVRVVEDDEKGCIPLRKPRFDLTEQRRPGFKQAPADGGSSK